MHHFINTGAMHFNLSNKIIKPLYNSYSGGRESTTLMLVCLKFRGFLAEARFTSDSRAVISLGRVFLQTGANAKKALSEAQWMSFRQKPVELAKHWLYTTFGVSQ